jgi:hypothetical protein
VSAELAARRTAAAAVLADFRAAEAAFERGLRDRPAYPAWALRLAQHLRYVLDAPGADDQATGQLEEIRLVLEASGWQADPPDIFALKDAAGDWQYALGQIDDVVNRRAADHAAKGATETDADAAWLRERAAETLQLRGRVADLADELDREAGVITPSTAAEIKRGTAARIRAALEAAK